MKFFRTVKIKDLDSRNVILKQIPIDKKSIYKKFIVKGLPFFVIKLENDKYESFSTDIGYSTKCEASSIEETISSSKIKIKKNIDLVIKIITNFNNGFTSSERGYKKAKIKFK